MNRAGEAVGFGSQASNQTFRGRYAMMVRAKRIIRASFFILLLLFALSLPCIAQDSTVNAVILEDGTIVSIGYSDWSSTLQPGQTQVNLGNIEIPDFVLSNYVVQNGSLVPKRRGHEYAAIPGRSII